MSEYKTKGGELQHCPKCGAVVPESAAVCPECGYEFSEIAANSSSVKLAEKLARLEYDEDKYEAIVTFPLPYSKADLLEFATALKPRILNPNAPLADAYLIKYQELLEKIKSNFPKDLQLMRFVNEFDNLYASIEAKKGKEARKNWLSEHSKSLIAAACVVVGLIVAGALIFAFRDTASNTAELCVQAVNKAISKDNLKNARQAVLDYKKNKDEVIEGYVNLLTRYFDEGKWEEAKSLVEYYGQGEYTGDLNHGLYNYLLSAGDYDKAEEYINVEEKPSDDQYYGYMEECVNLMCAAGLINPAQEFIARKALHFASNRSGYYSKERVQERLDKIVASYKKDNKNKK